MHHVAVEDLPPTALGDGVERWGLTEHLGATRVAINRYRIAPGEGLPGGLHAHADQEEVFVVLDGEATFETFDGEVPVREGEAIRFAPGEFQSGRNGGDDDLVVLALGAPKESEDVRIPLACRDCGHADLHPEVAGGELTLVCPDCGGEHDPRACPECGREDLRVTLDGGAGTVVVCPDCGFELAEPFEG